MGTPKFLFEADSLSTKRIEEQSYFKLGDELGSTQCIRRLLSWIRRLNPDELLLQEIEPSLESERLDVNTLKAGYKLVDRISYLRVIAHKGNDVVGYIHLRNLHYKDNSKKTTIYESVLNPISTRSQDYFLHVSKIHKIKVGGEFKTVLGTKFCQKDGLSYMCAHAALKMVIDNMAGPDRHLAYSDINQILGKDPGRRQRACLSMKLPDFWIKAEYALVFFTIKDYRNIKTKVLLQLKK